MRNAGGNVWVNTLWHSSTVSSIAFWQAGRTGRRTVKHGCAFYFFRTTSGRVHWERIAEKKPVPGVQVVAVHATFHKSGPMHDMAHHGHSVGIIVATIHVGVNNERGDELGVTAGFVVTPCILTSRNNMTKIFGDAPQYSFSRWTTESTICHVLG